MIQVLTLIIVRIAFLAIGLLSFTVNVFAILYAEFDGTMWPWHSVIMAVGLLGVFLPNFFERTKRDSKQILLFGLFFAVVTLFVEYELLNSHVPLVPGAFSLLSLVGSCCWVFVALSCIFKPLPRHPRHLSHV